MKIILYIYNTPAPQEPFIIRYTRTFLACLTEKDKKLLKAGAKRRGRAGNAHCTFLHQPKHHSEISHRALLSSSKHEIVFLILCLNNVSKASTCLYFLYIRLSCFCVLVLCTHNSVSFLFFVNVYTYKNMYL
jgi:hypothetical protein